MIPIYKGKDIEGLKRAGSALKEVFKIVEPLIKEGISTYEINAEIEKKITSLGATGPCKGYYGFPAMACISIDDELIHGIPSLMKVLRRGQIVSVDIVLKLNGYCADATRTYAVGEISEEKQKLIEITKRCFYNGISKLKEGARLGDLSSAIQLTAELNGYGVCRSFTGHGIGREMHEPPEVRNFGQSGTGELLKSGMCLAVEPMITMRDWRVNVDKTDGWTVRTSDALPSAHYENTVLITKTGCEILTE
ncbi:MAG: type I methionyl aminopeptidase [Clostridia bacterium]|nr:type I methionyl aminopeptidase [Clostridia bacterium]